MTARGCSASWRFTTFASRNPNRWASDGRSRFRPDPLRRNQMLMSTNVRKMMELTEPHEMTLSEIRKRHEAFMHFYKQNGGSATEECTVIGGMPAGDAWNPT